MYSHSAIDSLVVENVSFGSGPYWLQAELVYSGVGRPAGLAVIAGPHPLLGGHMHNNVVRALSDGLAERGLLTLRFNYRGIGESEGPKMNVAENLAQFFATSHVPCELDLWQDVQGAVSFIRQAGDSDLRVALIGYSFGCALLSKVASKQTDTALVFIAPTVDKHDYTTYFGDGRPKLVIGSADDFATSAADLQHWFSLLPGPKELILEQFDNHFFRGHEKWLAMTVADYLETLWKLTPHP